MDHKPFYLVAVDQEFKMRCHNSDTILFTISPYDYENFVSVPEQQAGLKDSD